VVRIDEGVRTQRWGREDGGDAVSDMRREVVAFARRHGMAPAILQDLAWAVAEAVAYAEGAAPRERMVVEAATDGEWVTVRVTGGAERAGSAAEAVLDLPLVMSLSDRFEYGAGGRGAGTSVLMEFAMAARIDGQSAGHRRTSRAGTRAPGRRSPTWAPRPRVEGARRSGRRR
jgi:hypothetical protein